jgi:chemotaxis protein MotB
MRTAKTAAAALLATLCAGCTHTEAYRDAKTEIDNQDAVIRRYRGELDACQAENALLRTRAEAAELEAKRLRELESSYKQATQDINDLEAKLRELDSRYGSLGDDVALKWDPRGAKYEVAESLLFDPGRFELKARGREVLKKLADRLVDRDEEIIVEGHTDNQPVRKTIKENPFGNLELSGKRALHVAHFLTHDGGLRSERVSYAGFGEWRPTVPNDGAANMAKNRRVEIIIVRKKDDAAGK